MRFSEFIAVPENTASEDAFKGLMMLLRQSANNEKEGSKMSWDAIQSYMSNIGHAMDYNTFKIVTFNRRGSNFDLVKYLHDNNDIDEIIVCLAVS